MLNNLTIKSNDNLRKVVNSSYLKVVSAWFHKQYESKVKSYQVYKKHECHQKHEFYEIKYE